jgi:trehalose synthase
MAHLTGLQIIPAPLDRLAALLAPDRAQQLRDAAARGRSLLEGRAVRNVNSTTTGGGVAEMLATLLAYGRGAGVDTRWLVIGGDAEFFTITKRLHNALHGSRGDGGPLGTAERAHYEAALAPNLAEFRERVRPGDIVLLHDPQTAGPARGLQDRDVHVIWRKVRGIEYAPPWVPDHSLQVISPSVDPFAFKNCDLDGGSVDRVLGLTGLIAGDISQPLAFKGRDGSSQVVRRHTDLLWGTEPVPADAAVITQVSRWDALTDMAGVMVAFAASPSTSPRGYPTRTCSWSAPLSRV